MDYSAINKMWANDYGAFIATGNPDDGYTLEYVYWTGGALGSIDICSPETIAIVGDRIYVADPDGTTIRYMNLSSIPATGTEWKKYVRFAENPGQWLLIMKRLSGQT